MKFSYNWLQSFFSKKLPSPKKLAELLTLHFAEVEEIEEKGKDFVFDIDIRPNRAPDCFSHLGVAREISAILNLKLKKGRDKLKEDKSLKSSDFCSLEIKNKSTCLRYSAKVIKEVKVSFSPKWLRDRLQACGVKPVNNIVDITNYVMLETGQPLHAFDLDKIEGKKIVVRFAKRGERIETLDNEKYELTPDILVISDSKKPIAIAGIKGGKNSGIEFNSKNILLESANFNPQVVRQGSKTIDLKTDASWRFEHGLDPNLTEFAIERASLLIQKLAKGKIAKGLIDFYPKKSLPKKIKLGFDLVKRILGIEISKSKIKEILSRLGFKILKSSNEFLVVEVPTFRLDIAIPEDLVEEIGRIYGLEKIPEILPLATLIPPQKNPELFWENITKDTLKELGFTEVYNYSFVSKNDARVYGFDKMLELKNPLSSEFQFLRPSLIPNLLKNIHFNQKFFKEIRIFELGKIFIAPNKEKKMLTGAILGEAFLEAKGVVDVLLERFGLSNIWYDEYQATPENSKITLWHPKRIAEIKVDQEEIGFLGEISLRVLSKLGIKERVTVFDIDFGKLAKLANEEREYLPPSPYPAVIRDIAVLVPKTTRIKEVVDKIYQAGYPIVRDVDLFDIYEGEELPEGKKNLAFHIIFQVLDRALTPEEIEKAQNKIIKLLEKKPTWQVRKK